MATLFMRDLVKIYAGRKVVNKVNLNVTSGEVVGLLGPNGAGKTTTFYMTVGLIQPDDGRIFLDETDISDFTMPKRARLGVGYLPQEASVFRKLTVEENILVVLECLNYSRNDKKERTEILLTELGIRHLAKQKASVLSGGERRRLEISRALAVNPSFILLDEPFAGIDPLAVIDIKNIITQLKDKNIGILISDHNVRETLGVCGRAYILNEGEVIEEGPPAKIADSKTAKQIYLGNEFKL